MPRQIEAFGQDRILALWEERLFILSRTACNEAVLKVNGRHTRWLAIGARNGTEATGSQTLIEDIDLNIYSWDERAGQVSRPLLRGTGMVSAQVRHGRGPSNFAITADGLLRSVGKTFRLALSSRMLRDPAQISGTKLQAVSENRDGEGILSMAFPHDWVGIWEWGKDRPLRLVPGSAAQTSRVLAVARNGDAIAIYNSQQVWLREQGKWSALSPIPAPFRTASGLFFDSHDRLWVASSSGLQMLRANRQRWSNVNFPFPNLKNHLVSLLTSLDGKLLLGTADGLVTHDGDGHNQERTHAGKQRLGLVTGLVQTSDGAIWLSSGASFNGAFRLAAGTVTHYGAAEGLPDTPLHKLVVDSAGTLWALSTGSGRPDEEGGAYVWDGRSFHRWKSSAGLLSRIYSMTRTADGALWFASRGGMSRFLNEKWRHWSLSEGLKAKSLFFVAPRPDGGVFFLDRGNGLGEIDSSGTVHYTRIGTSTAANSAWELRLDESGNLWVATRGGLYVRRDNVWSWIGQPAGLENQELWPLAIWQNQVCSGSDGSGVFCLNRSVLASPPPKIEFESSHSDAGAAELNWRVLNFEDSSRAEGNASRFRLDSFTWSPWQESRRVSFPKLAAGPHRIEVEAKDQFGSRTAKPGVLEFTIPAPFFAQPRFLVPVGVSLGAAFIAILAFLSHKLAHNRQLAEKEERFRALLEYSSVGITLRDRNQRVFYVSPAINAILGYDPEELIGDFREDLLHPDDVAGAEARSRSLVEVPGQTLRSRVRMRHKNGEYRWIELTARNLLQNPVVAAIVTNLRDVTDSTRAEIAASEARSRAELANHAKSDFLAMISHEIRTPMNGITGMCHLLLDTTLNKEQQEYADTIAQSAQSLLALINDVLDFSRIEAGKLSIERAPIHLEALVAEVAQLMRVRADQKLLRLVTQYPPDAPRGFYGDALRIRQILINLVSNAVKFTHEGEIRIEVSVLFTEASQYRVSIAVCDTGIGIAPEKLSLVFEKFTQADLSTTRRYGGSGLGLSISRSLTHLMGGSLTASSQVGSGSQFRLEVPMDVAPESAIERRDLTRPSMQPLAESLDILLVEDNLVNQKLATRLLERFGCTVAVASSGIEALARISESDYDLVLMDCQMPEMDGYETTQLIRAAERGTKRLPIVAITANAMESDLERCIASGMDSYLTKPIDFVKLRDALEKWGIDSRVPKATSDRDAT